MRGEFDAEKRGKGSRASITHSAGCGMLPLMRCSEMFHEGCVLLALVESPRGALVSIELLSLELLGLARFSPGVCSAEGKTTHLL